MLRPDRLGCPRRHLGKNRIKKRNGAICCPLSKEKKSCSDQYTTKANERQSERAHSGIRSELKDIGGQGSSQTKIGCMGFHPSRYSNHDFPRLILSFYIPRICHFASRHFVILHPPRFAEIPKSPRKTAHASENCSDYLIYSLLLFRDIVSAPLLTHSHIPFSQIPQESIDSSLSHPV